MKKKNRILIIILVAVVVVFIAAIAAGVIYWKTQISIKITDVSKYTEYLGKNGEYKNHCGYNNVIFPNEIPESAEVEEFCYRYFNLLDPNYVGYLVYKCDEEDYQEEYERLKGIKSFSNPYIYGAESFPYELCAVHANEYYGYVYALADEENQRFIYVEIQFCNYFTDVDYKAMIPEKYLPDGFDATSNNPTQQEFEAQIEF